MVKPTIERLGLALETAVTVGSIATFDNAPSRWFRVLGHMPIWDGDKSP